MESRLHESPGFWTLMYKDQRIAYLTGKQSQDPEGIRLELQFYELWNVNAWRRLIAGQTGWPLQQMRLAAERGDLSILKLRSDHTAPRMVAAWKYDLSHAVIVSGQPEKGEEEIHLDKLGVKLYKKLIIRNVPPPVRLETKEEEPVARVLEQSELRRTMANLLGVDEDSVKEVRTSTYLVTLEETSPNGVAVITTTRQVSIL